MEKMISQKIFIGIIFCCWHCQLQAQRNELDSLLKNCREEIQIINNMQLYRTFVSCNGYSLTMLEPDCNVWYAIYFDSTGKIRKSKDENQYPESNGYSYHYYNELGISIYSINYEFSGMSNGYSSSRYLDNKGTLLCYDLIQRDDDNNGEIIEHSIYYQSIDSKIPYYDRLIDIDNLKKAVKITCEIDNLVKPANCILVKFKPPQINDKTIINGNTVHLRKQPSVKSPAIAQLNVGDVVTVVGKNDEWYQVKFKEQTGYVHSNFLEPLEHE
jgi:hypothetical protein